MGGRGRGGRSVGKVGDIGLTGRWLLLRRERTRMGVTMRMRMGVRMAKDAQLVSGSAATRPHASMKPRNVMEKLIAQLERLQ